MNPNKRYSAREEKLFLTAWQTLLDLWVEPQGPELVEYLHRHMDVVRDTVEESECEPDEPQPMTTWH